jgi:hypothetical protein
MALGRIYCGPGAPANAGASDYLYIIIKKAGAKHSPSSWLPNSERRILLVHAFQIFLGARVDLDLVADFDKQGNLDFQTGFQFRALGQV